MSAGYREYKTARFERPSQFFILIVLIAFSVYLVYVLFDQASYWYAVFLIFPFLFFILLIQGSLINRLRVGPDYIKYITTFKKEKMNFKDVKRFGLYIIGRYGKVRLIDELELPQIDRDEVNIFIFLSTKRFVDIHNIKSSETIVFPFHDDYYHVIGRILKTTYGILPSKVIA
ncbi:MAG: hypothetical protein KF725_09710 [Cyclobacteriaceae bacterium]|nr:hypothetical protein [Cyclobacteriaceae bacterium]UYN85993.1 MAG: hypothetical protein KIT51_14105 [Cyclobacteriaceae bacterium]